MSLDAYRHQTGGSITVAVTGTDNPVPTDLARPTPESSPVVPEEAEPAKGRRKKKAT